MRIITSTIWDQWSDRVASRTDLPRWTESLIRATADIADIRFPSGDAGQLHGYDGRLEEGHWRDVRVIDAVDLESWLEDAPSVALDFAAENHIYPPGINSLTQFWKRFASRTKPSMSCELVVAGRDQQRQRLLEEMSADRHVVLQADSRDEALAFAAATVMLSDDPVRKKLLARAVVVESEDTAQRLPGRVSLIVGLKAPSSSAGLLRERGHLIILPLGNDAVQRRDILFKLPKATRGEFSQALQQMGIPPESAERLAAECGRSVTVLQRRTGDDYDPARWALEPSARAVLIPALFAGAWNAESPADRALLEVLSGQDYKTFEEQLIPLSSVPDPPVEKIGRMWAVTAPVDAFEQLSRYMSQTHIERLATAVNDSFSEADPVLALPAEERQYAGIRGLGLRHSDWLRDGLAEALLIIAVLGQGRITGITNCQAFVESLVEKLPGLHDDRRVITSLSRQLSTLMEAAPRPLLDALERQLEGDADATRDAFFGQDGLFGPTSPHVHILWALERAAWDPYWLQRATAILLKLSAIDPGGNTQNRPLNSLREIFLP